MNNGILFLDIDGVLLTKRAWVLQNFNTEGTPIETQSKKERAMAAIFDPVAVAFLNRLCHLGGIKIVIHSYWRRTIQDDDILLNKLIEQGIKKEYFHEDFACPMKMTSEKIHDIGFWLSNHRLQKNPLKRPDIELMMLNRDEYDRLFEIWNDEQDQYGFPYIIIDDDLINASHQVQTSYANGLDLEAYFKLCGIFDIKDPLYDIFPLSTEIKTKILPHFKNEFNMKLWVYQNELSHLFSFEAAKNDFDMHKSCCLLSQIQPPKSIEEFYLSRQKSALSQLPDIDNNLSNFHIDDNF